MHARAGRAVTATVPLDMRAVQPPLEECPSAAAAFGQPVRHLTSVCSSGPFEPGLPPTEHALMAMALA